MYIYKKNVLTNFFWVLNLGQVGGPDKKIKNTLLVGFLKNHSKSRLFEKSSINLSDLEKKYKRNPFKMNCL